jgi:hypothetical protein
MSTDPIEEEEIFNALDTGLVPESREVKLVRRLGSAALPRLSPGSTLYHMKAFKQNA